MVLGTDGAGIVVAKGNGVRRLGIGDEVWAYAFDNPKGGFYAEYVAVDADSAAPLPAPLHLLSAGAALATGLTAQQGIDDHPRLRRGETVLIFGASGAVGTLAVQFAKRKKARVFRTIRYDAEAGPRQYARLERAVTEARLRVPIAARYTLAQASKAHARVEKGHAVGRVVLQIRRSRR
jgi:NADPH:quinone reductase-like Zn-dependent oxidoreductase